MRAMQVRTVVTAGILVLGLAVAVLAQGVAAPPGPGVAPPPGPNLYGPYGFGPHRFGPYLFGPWMWVAGLFFVLRVLFLVGLVLVVWRVLSARLLWERLDPATRILRERYARGEISEDEYRKRLATPA